MAKRKGNRFEGFEDLGVKQEDSEAVSKPSINKTGKSASPDFKKVTLYLSKELHLRMKSHTLTEEENMSDLVERVMSEYFKQLDS